MRPEWREDGAAAQLETGHVHVWLFSLEAAPQALLSADEQARAARFALPQHGRAFAARRTWLRLVLGHYLGCDPLAVEFVYGPDGKPELSEQFSRQDPLRFNSSSSGDWLLIGVTLGSDIGVDIERIDANRDVETIAQEVLSGREMAMYRTIIDEEKPRAFTKVWTQKEAFVKATGRGIIFPLREVDVAITPDDPGRLIALQGNSEATANWAITAFEAVPGYPGAVAVARPGVTFHYFRGSTQAFGVRG